MFWLFGIFGCFLLLPACVCFLEYAKGYDSDTHEVTPKAQSYKIAAIVFFVLVMLSLIPLFLMLSL